MTENELPAGGGDDEQEAAREFRMNRYRWVMGGDGPLFSPARYWEHLSLEHQAERTALVAEIAALKLERAEWLVDGCPPHNADVEKAELRLAELDADWVARRVHHVAYSVEADVRWRERDEARDAAAEMPAAWVEQGRTDAEVASGIAEFEEMLANEEGTT